MRSSLIARFRTFVRLPATDYLLLTRAAGAVIRARLELWLRRFANLRFPDPSPVSDTKVPARRIAWAVNTAAACIPASTCLVRAIASQRLLSVHGHMSKLQVGVSNSAAAGFRAHAWIEQQDEVLVGATEDKYTPLVNLAGWGVIR